MNANEELGGGGSALTDDRTESEAGAEGAGEGPPRLIRKRRSEAKLGHTSGPEAEAGAEAGWEERSHYFCYGTTGRTYVGSFVRSSTTDA